MVPKSNKISSRSFFINFSVENRITSYNIKFAFLVTFNLVKCDKILITSYNIRNQSLLLRFIVQDTYHNF